MVLFPACAGVIPTIKVALIASLTVPRMCGGDPVFLTDKFPVSYCSPHVRG